MDDLSPTNEQHHEDGEPPAKRKKRKARPKVSCQPCQRRKTRCEETEGSCNQCDKRGEADKCTWDPPPLAGPLPNDITVEFGKLKRRMADLEREMGKLRDQKDNPAPAPLPPLPSPAPITYRALPSAAPAPFTPFAPPPVALPTPPDKKVVEAETEDAAQALESLALPVATRLGQLKAPLTTTSPDTDPHRSPAAAESPPAVQPGAFTTIRLGASQQTSPALLEKLPHPDIIHCLCEHFWTGDIGFIYVVLHRQTFEAEVNELIQCVRKNDTSRIDPAWLASLWMVMIWSASTIGPIEAGKIASHGSLAELKALPETWLQTFESALQASQWAEKPQVRAAQAILLKVAYNRTPPHGIYLGLETPSFFIWLGAATRISQLLGLHRLGSDPTVMPKDHDDPAWPSKPCALKREMGKRIWWFCASMDFLFCMRAGMGQIALGSFDTAEPLNVDDADLGLELTVKERPFEYLSDMAFCIMKCGIANQTAIQFTADSNGDIDYSLVLDIGARMREALSRCERAVADSSDHRRPYHRTLMLLPQLNRVLRLHRPFFMRGWTEPLYATSTEDAMTAASAICLGLEELRVDDGNLEHVWFSFAYGLSAIFVIYVTLLRDERKGPTPATEELRKLISSARAFYARGAQGDASTVVRQVSLQAVQVIDALLLPRGAPQTSHSTTPSAVASIFLKIASVVQPPTITRPSSPAPDGGDSTMQPPPTERFALDGAISSLLSLAPHRYDAFPASSFTTTNLSDLHHPPLSFLGGSAPSPLFDPTLHHPAYGGSSSTELNSMLGLGMMNSMDGNVFNEENTAARDFLATFSVNGPGATPLPLPGGEGATPQPLEWDFSSVIGGDWV
ncbi:hypothetical protein BCR35DRAFT_355790 [Leucosporidium creatinivorum]|uniref:Zn(2)-C6 fungal-type domain-containing protein n=1 Tax=Leucosporidium creatinivorum TaxID=106004 RepID=A0A1Y2D7A1_9BASI|nr:hypothetical protein BCR35DRAFT_355790 [Leucosporidium creatinivorum]